MESKKIFYADLIEQVKAITEGTNYWVTNLSNASAVIYHELRSQSWFEKKPINWAGFYIVDPENPKRLILGPFQGKVACLVIEEGKGVCGKAAKERKTQRVDDVHTFDGHIACDSASNSEIVVPLVFEEASGEASDETDDMQRLVGVLDIDCEETHGFDEEDEEGLKAVASVIVNSCRWETRN